MKRLGEDLPVLADEEVLQEDEVCPRLGIGGLHFGALVAADVLEPALTRAGQQGVTSRSVEREEAFRRSAGFLRKVLRALRVALNFRLGRTARDPGPGDPGTAGQPVMTAWISCTGMVRVAEVARRSAMMPDSPLADQRAVHFWMTSMVAVPRWMYWWRRSPVG